MLVSNTKGKLNNLTMLRDVPYCSIAAGSFFKCGFILEDLGYIVFFQDFFFCD